MNFPSTKSEYFVREVYWLHLKHKLTYSDVSALCRMSVKLHPSRCVVVGSVHCRILAPRHLITFYHRQSVHPIEIRSCRAAGIDFHLSPLVKGQARCLDLNYRLLLRCRSHSWNISHDPNGFETTEEDDSNRKYTALAIAVLFDFMQVLDGTYARPSETAAVAGAD